MSLTLHVRKDRLTNHPEYLDYSWRVQCKPPSIVTVKNWVTYILYVGTYILYVYIIIMLVKWPKLFVLFVSTQTEGQANKLSWL